MIKAIYQQASSVLSRNFRRRPWRVVEFRRYNDASVREAILPVFLILSGFYLYDLSENGPESLLWQKYEFAVHPDKSIKRTFDSRQDPYNPGYLRSGKTFEEYYPEMMKLHHHRYIISWIWLLLPLFFLLLGSYPNGRPVRFDPVRRLAYTWSFGRFYIAHLPEKDPLEALDPRPQRAMLRYVAALVITLPHCKHPEKTLNRALGIFEPATDDQCLETGLFLNDYLQEGDTPGDPYAPAFQSPGFVWKDLLRWALHFSLFPGFGYNEKKTEKAIQRFLAMNNIMDRRQYFLDHPHDPENPFSKEELAGK